MSPVPAGLHSETLRPHIADVRSYPIFISSAQDAEVLRDRVERIVTDCINKQLSMRGWHVHFPIWRWEDVEARAADRGETVNDTFVQMARESSVVMVLLLDDLKPGTRDEMMAVRDDADVDLKVLWFRRARRLRLRRSSVERFLAGHQDVILHTRIDGLDSEEAWVVLTRNLIATLLKALQSDDREPYVERR
jgi:hypothetical protein